MSAGLVFFDTNILVYADDCTDKTKQSTAVRLFASHYRSRTAVLSLQVLQEYFVTVTRKLRVSAEFAQQKVELLSRARMVRFTEQDLVSAIELHRLSGISFWDSMIVHSARTAGAPVLYTEDLQHGSTIAGVAIVNPFLDARTSAPKRK